MKHRFQKGNKEYLKRKKRGFPDATSTLLVVLARPERVKRKGRIVYQPRMQTIVDNLRTAAIKGEVAAARHLIDLHENTVDLKKLVPITYVFEPGEDDL